MVILQKIDKLDHLSSKQMKTNDQQNIGHFFDKNDGRM